MVRVRARGKNVVSSDDLLARHSACRRFRLAGCASSRAAPETCASTSEQASEGGLPGQRGASRCAARSTYALAFSSLPESCSLRPSRSRRPCEAWRARRGAQSAMPNQLVFVSIKVTGCGTHRRECRAAKSCREGGKCTARQSARSGALRERARARAPLVRLGRGL